MGAGHFHTYLLLGMMAMMLRFMTYLGGARGPLGIAPVGFWLYLLGGATFVLAFLAAGSASVPRRYAVHVSAWLPHDRLGSLGACLAFAGALILVVRFLAALPAAAARDDPPLAS
jgi:cytochrome c oxidase subunit I